MKKKKIYSKLASYLVTALLITSICLCLFVFVQVVNRGYVSIFGYSFFRVYTGSMEPSIPVGSLILTKETDIEDIEINDIVSFYSKEKYMQGKIITHKIIRVTGEGADAVVVTQGVANPEPDPAIHASDVMAVMQYKTHVIDKVYGVISTTPGFICLVLVPMMAMIVFEIVDLAKEIHKAKEEEGGKENDEA